MNLRINPGRLSASLDEFAGIGATARGGCNRQALSDADREGRDRFAQWARAAGCTVTVDAIGNIFARRPGSEPDAAAVMASSHLDTQGTGGRFDGVYGVLAGLEVLRTLRDHGVVTRRPIDVVSWTNEEGCRFAPAMLGSGVVSGAYALEYGLARADQEGRTIGDELARIGYRGARAVTAPAVHAAFELHIEQGPILEAEGITIGAVTGIQGASWFDVTLRGEACHAGPTPMEQRRDPWRAATGIIDGAYALAAAAGPWGRCTIGNVRCSPGARNTVPESVIVSIDLRHPEAAVLERMTRDLEALGAAQAVRARVDFALLQVWHMPATAFTPRLVQLVSECATRLGYSQRRIVSGAGHDSLHIAQYAPATMIFIPCAGGLSHNELESAAAADVEAGANVLLHAMMVAANE